MENFHFVTCILEVPKKKAGLNIYDPFFWGGGQAVDSCSSKGWRWVESY